MNSIHATIGSDANHSKQTLLRSQFMEHVDQLKAVIAEEMNDTQEELFGKSRRKNSVTARQVFFKIVREEIGLMYPRHFTSLLKIGELIGRDHSTALWSIKQMDLYLKNPGEEHVRRIYYTVRGRMRIALDPKSIDTLKMKKQQTKEAMRTLAGVLKEINEAIKEHAQAQNISQS